MKYLRTLTLLALVITLACFAYFKLRIEAMIDSTAPVIEMESDEISISVDATDEDLLQGLTATDDRDGDVTDTLVVESMGKFTENGKMKVSYAAFDKGGNVGTISRIVRYSDYESPRFAISAPLRMSRDSYNAEYLSAISATDCIDGNLTGFIKYKMGEDSYYGKEGSNLISFQVTNSKGDTAKIEVYLDLLDEKEISKPYPVLDQYLVYTKVGEKISPSSFLKGVMRSSSVYKFDDEDNTRYTKEMVSINDKTDYSTPGTYQVVYTLYSDEKNEGEDSVQGHVTLFVVVEE